MWLPILNTYASKSIMDYKLFKRLKYGLLKDPWNNNGLLISISLSIIGTHLIELMSFNRCSSLWWLGWDVMVNLCVWFSTVCMM